MNMLGTTEGFSHIRLGTPEDNEAILEFYSSVAMDAGDIHLRYDRAPGFFDFLACQGERGFVIIFERDDDQPAGKRAIGGVATIAVRPGLRDGKETTVAYFADLRLSPALERGHRVQFRRWYEILVTTAAQNTDLGASGLMYSAILDKNRMALASLVRKNGDVLYAPMNQYQGITVFGRWPWARLSRRQKTQSWQIEEQTNFSDTQLISFLQKCNAQKSFGYVFPQELQFRQAKWPNLERYPFILIKNEQGQILASALPWEGSPSRKAVIEKIPSRLKIAAQLLPLIQGTRIRENEVLKSLYLTHLEFDPSLNAHQRGQALKMIVDTIFGKKYFRSYHMLSFVENNVQPAIGSLKGYYSQRTPATAYQVMARTEGEAAVGESFSALEIATL